MILLLYSELKRGKKQGDGDGGDGRIKREMLLKEKY